MKLSEQLNQVKEQYEHDTESYKEYELLPCMNCQHPETKYCLKCGECGRMFDSNGILIDEKD